MAPPTPAAKYSPPLFVSHLPAGVESCDNFTTCETCGETAVRIISPIQTHFVGHGWPDKDDRWAKDHERAAQK